MQQLNGVLHGKGRKVGIIVSRFNEFITSKLLDGALDVLLRHEVQEEDITVAWVPGAFEIPSTAKLLAGRGAFDGIICLGAVIRGATPHFDFVAAEVSKGVAQVNLDFEVPVGFGVLTTDTIDQAIERAGSKSGNKGADAALAVLELIDLQSRISAI